ncbi:DUF5928 domain-containing protein [Jannaschia formosa]|uniref:DUF5928 domain-containing protein n=1 Tax=Jannaschia formosa TaxID=2259592 RepID=UPI000E1B66B8|nr:DUF5928 domain-containing protein [Jannaschia formosa]TFL17635.1 glycosyl transferase [Jannaschia formosa]
MARLAFLLLCHRNPEGVIAQARALTAAGDFVAIHLDARAPKTDAARLEAAFSGNPAVTLARRVRCGWGEWSLVRATLNAAEAALAAFPDATHLYLVSGDCRPITSALQAHSLLAARPLDRIETVDFFTSGWIRTGFVEERLVYRHWFNERSRKRLFYASLDVQQRLGLRREIPEGIEMRIGSQWWCLRRGTVEKVLAFCRARPDVVRFFRTTWIPDETFFQTLVAHLVPRGEIEPHPPTFLTFTDYGMPATFHDDHHDLLVAQPEFFARKIGPEARQLRARLDALWASDEIRTAEAGDGRRLHAFVAARGRRGRRFGRRIWEAGAEMGERRSLLVIVCRDRPLGRALARAVDAQATLPALGYLFHDEEVALPDLGGIESSLAKRSRHRRAVLRLIFDALATDRLAICAEPGDLGLLLDVRAGRAELRVLLVDRPPTEEDLRRKAIAEGLAGPDTPEAQLAALLPALADRAAEEVRRLSEADLPGLVRLREDAPEDAVIAALGQVLDCGAAVAAQVAREAGLTGR